MTNEKIASFPLVEDKLVIGTEGFLVQSAGAAIANIFKNEEELAAAVIHYDKLANVELHEATQEENDQGISATIVVSIKEKKEQTFQYKFPLPRPEERVLNVERAKMAYLYLQSKIASK